MTLIEFIKFVRENILKLFNTKIPKEVEEVKEKLEELTETIREEEDMTEPNHVRFSDNIFEVDDILVGSDKYKLYLARFSNLFDVYEYLKANPKLNRKVFYRLHSETGSRDFAGKPYEEAVEDLVSDIDPGYEEFLRLQKDINNASNIEIHKYKTVRTVAGGHLNIPAYSMGNPLCYETEQKISKPKFVRIHVSLSYYWGTSKQQVLHRAIIITNILKALERAGYNVDLNTFELSSNSNELIYIVVNVKKHGEKLNMQALYKTLCHVEFLRRILFRILETLDVKNDWEDGYGTTCSESFVRKALKFNKNDIFFDQPREMGITGEDLAKDFERAITHLNLEDKIDVEKAKEEFKNDTMSLKLKK